MEKIYSIGGLNVKISGEETLHIVTQLPGFDIFETDNLHNNKDIDIRIRMDENIDSTSLTQLRPIHSFNELDIKHTLSVYADGYLFEMHRSDGSCLISILYATHGNEVLMSPCDCEISIKYALWMAYTLPALGKDIMPIHASSIVKDEGAVLFLGESGTGKSTHTRLWLQYIENSYLLNDDSPLLRIKNNKVYVCGSPWSGKTHCYRQEIIPLKAIVRLSQYPENVMSCSGRLASIGSIHPSCPPPLAYDNNLSSKVIHVIDTIIKETPVYALKCRPDSQAAHIAYTTIY